MNYLGIFFGHIILIHLHLAKYTPNSIIWPRQIICRPKHL